LNALVTRTGVVDDVFHSETFLLCSLDEGIEEEIEKMNDLDETFEYSHPEFVVDIPITDAERQAARQAEVDFLESFPAYEYVPIEQWKNDPEGQFISSRWEEGRKQDGSVRSRWVLREFNRGPTHGNNFAATPNEGEVDALHARALMKGHSIRYFDVSRAFPHAMEERHIYTNPPEGYEKEGFVLRALRKLNGTQDGSKGFSEWFRVQLMNLGFTSNKITPTYFTSKNGEISVSAHVDDGACEGDDNDLDWLFEELGKVMILKETGRLLASDNFDRWVSFLSRERCRKGDKILKKVSPKFILESMELLNIEPGNPTPTPMTKLLASKDSGPPLDVENHSLFRSVVGKLIHVQPDFEAAQYAIKELARELQAPTTDSLERLHHLVRYLSGQLDVVHVIEPKAAQAKIVVSVDANWAGCHKTRKSTGTINCSVFGVSLHTSSKTQPTVAQSSAHSELHEIQRGAHFGIYMSNFWSEAYGEVLPIEILTDSAAAKTLGTRRGVGRVRHLAVKEIYIQELTNSGRVRLVKINGHDNVADIGTKILDKQRIEFLLNKLNVKRWDGVSLSSVVSVSTGTALGGRNRQLGALLSLLLPTLANGAIIVDKDYDYDYYEFASSSTASTVCSAWWWFLFFITCVVGFIGYYFVYYPERREQVVGGQASFGAGPNPPVGELREQAFFGEHREQVVGGQASFGAGPNPPVMLPCPDHERLDNDDTDEETKAAIHQFFHEQSDSDGESFVCRRIPPRYKNKRCQTELTFKRHYKVPRCVALPTGEHGVWSE
jgi:hypothetical protein